MAAFAEFSLRQKAENFTMEHSHEEMGSAAAKRT
jgi:hypothetical protein